MQLTGLPDLLRDTPAYRALLSRLQNGTIDHNMLNVIRAARPFVAGALAYDWPAPIIYITGRVDRAYNVAEQLPVWVGERRVLRFAEPTPMFYDRAPWGETVIRNRIAALAALLPPDDYDPLPPPIIVTSARALMQRSLPVNHFRKGSMVLRVGQRHVIDKLLTQWLQLGYTPASIVVEPGSFSRRGGVIDIFPVAADRPYRIEFFDDEIDSLRVFDPASQRSAAQVEYCPITPAREALPERTQSLATHLEAWFATLPPTEDDAMSPMADLEPLSNGVSFPYIEHYLPYLYANPVSLLDYAPGDALIIIDDMAEFHEIIDDVERQAVQSREERLATNQLPSDYPLPYLTRDVLLDSLMERVTVQLTNRFDEDDGRPDGDLFVPGQRFGGQVRPMLNHLRALRKQGERIVVVTQQASRLTELWREQEPFIPKIDDIIETPPQASLQFVDGVLGEGWRLNLGDGELHLLTDAEIFGWRRPEPRRRATAAPQPPRIPDFAYTDLNEGDYVVHVDYGIGRFAGMRRRTIEGNQREYLLVEYAGTDVLFVPIHQADRLTRYVGAGDKPPQLNKLGKTDWQQVKSKIKKAVEEEARELLQLYARRLNTSGHAFLPDVPWQHELEASFPYVETEDQLRAVREVKADMEKPYPMDRLICGDVGYGKTEVALRAAFKAVMDGKQVALLVPTTVLAQQHFDTFSQRLAAFPVNVEMMSRFRTKEEQRRALPRIASGEIDIVIGTHRLLSDDVRFKELGLLIIDEEQRFGVTHKEHFKKMRTQVDVLTMTATPIPRTLYMSLTNLRDISMIQTPPEERLPVITHVGAYDERLVRQAVLRELERGGQVFFVHNRVRTIEVARERLERIVPEARIVVAHGQMNERQLEAVMSQFGHGEYDVLVATSLIENGIDIPTANTLIIDRADWFGMAQLYQLRGRVGRSAQQAYAYFFHHGAGGLTLEARERLETLAEYGDLGAGFQIAMRDLELRGAGDILSTRQTGHVAAVGLHLYTQMVTQAVNELKAETDTTPLPVAMSNITIDLPLPAYIPTDWIPEMELRLQIYRRIGNLATMEDVDAIREELRDRFGQLPIAVDGLLYQIDVKLLAREINATAVIDLSNVIHIKLPYLAEVNREALQAYLGGDIRVSRTAVMLPVEDGTWQLRLLDVLRILAQGVQTEETL